MEISGSGPPPSRGDEGSQQVRAPPPPPPPPPPANESAGREPPQINVHRDRFDDGSSGRVEPSSATSQTHGPASESHDGGASSRVRADLQRDSFDQSSVRSTGAERSERSEGNAQVLRQEQVQQAKDLQDYAQRKAQEAGATQGEVPRALQGMQAAADRNASDAVNGLERTGARSTTDADAKLLDHLDRSQRLDAIDALNRGGPGPASPTRPTTQASPSVDSPERDRRTRERALDLIARRRFPGRDPSSLTPAERADVMRRTHRMAQIMSQNGDVQRGYERLLGALDRGRMRIGLAGINNWHGGRRTDTALENTRQNMSFAGGGEVDAVIDNANGARMAYFARPNARQTAELREMAQLARELNLPLDVTSHSNGFNALAAVARESPPGTFGHINLVNPNVPGRTDRTTEDMRAMVRASERVSLTTSLSDDAIPLSQAGIAGNGAGWRNQITAAVRAGISDIRVLSRALHGLDSITEHGGTEPASLDFYRPRPGAPLQPRDTDAWERQTGWRWNGERFVRVPRPRQSAAALAPAAA